MEILDVKEKKIYQSNDNSVFDIKMKRFCYELYKIFRLKKIEMFVSSDVNDLNFIQINFDINEFIIHKGLRLSVIKLLDLTFNPNSFSFFQSKDDFILKINIELNQNFN